MTICSLDVLLFLFGTSLLFHVSSNCCFLTCIQVFQEAGQVVWYSHLFQKFPLFIVIHTVKDFGIVNKAEVDVFLELSCFFDDPMDVGNWTSGISWFTYCWSLAWREHYFSSVWGECNCAAVWAFFGIAFLREESLEVWKQTISHTLWGQDPCHCHNYIPHSSQGRYM